MEEGRQEMRKRRSNDGGWRREKERSVVRGGGREKAERWRANGCRGREKAGRWPTDAEEGRREKVRQRKCRGRNDVRGKGKGEGRGNAAEGEEYGEEGRWVTCSQVNWLERKYMD